MQPPAGIIFENMTSNGRTLAIATLLSWGVVIVFFFAVLSVYRDDFGGSDVVAATFDDLSPATSGMKIGTLSSPWRSLNSTLYFRGVHVGVGSAQNPGAGFTCDNCSILEVPGGIRFGNISEDPLPTCTSTIRGLFWVQHVLYQADRFQVCVRGASNNYFWRTL